jgi:hypothetical protein
MALSAAHVFEPTSFPDDCSGTPLQDLYRHPRLSMTVPTLRHDHPNHFGDGSGCGVWGNQNSLLLNKWNIHGLSKWGEYGDHE